MTTLFDQEGNGMTFDHVLSIKRTSKNRVSSHPLGDGRSVSDHSNLAPLEFEIVASMTATPNQEDDFGTGPDRLLNAQVFLQSLRGQVLSLTEEKLGGDVPDLALLSDVSTITVKLAVPFTLQFRQIQFGFAETVDLPALAQQEQGSSKEKEAGSQPAEEKAASRSTLVKLLR